MTEARYRDGMRVMLPLMPAIVAFGASFGAAGVAVLLRAPLLVVVVAAAATAAGLRVIW